MHQVRSKAQATNKGNPLTSNKDMTEAMTQPGAIVQTRKSPARDVTPAAGFARLVVRPDALLLHGVHADLEQIVQRWIRQACLRQQRHRARDVVGRDERHDANHGEAAVLELGSALAGESLRRELGREAQWIPQERDLAR